jgi:hypothetical protein
MYGNFISRNFEDGFTINQFILSLPLFFQIFNRKNTNNEGVNDIWRNKFVEHHIVK